MTVRKMPTDLAGAVTGRAPTTQLLAVRGTEWPLGKDRQFSLIVIENYNFGSIWQQVDGAVHELMDISAISQAGENKQLKLFKSDPIEESPSSLQKFLPPL